MLEKLLRCGEKKVRKIIQRELELNGYEPIIDPDFIYAEGTVPVLLVAHYDTVLKNPPSNIINDNGVLSAKNGLGADDRAGVYAILKIIEKYLKCLMVFQ